MIFRDFFPRVFSRLYSLSRPEVFKPSEQDVFLASYPRSGNTWMRVILAELLYGESGRSIKDLEYYIPDIHLNHPRRDVIDSEFNIVKSHRPFIYRENMAIYKTIYLIRDPRDVVLSHYRYLKALRYPNDFNQFLLDWITGRIWPTSWYGHVRSWFGPGIENIKIDICVVRYEDLLSEPVVQINKIADFIGVEWTIEMINHALDKASVDNMRTREKSGLREYENTEGMKFIGEAVSGQWKNRLSSEQVNLIEEYANREMEEFGYL